MNTIVKMKQPEIRIRYGWHLDEFFRQFVEIGSKIKKDNYSSRAEIELKIRAYKRAWGNIEKVILAGMSNVLGLEFYQKIIDVYVVGRARSVSDPLIVSSHFAPDEFCDVLTHELIHRILTDNTKRPDVGSIWSKMFPRESRLVRNHVLVHAVHEYLYREVLKDISRLNRDIEKCNEYPGYKRSWEIVKETGYQQIIERFRGFYK